MKDNIKWRYSPAGGAIESLAQESLDIQDACNILALAHGFVRVISELRVLYSRADVNDHPIVKLWVDKFASLTNTQTLGDDRIFDAYAEVFKIINRKDNP